MSSRINRKVNSRIAVKIYHPLMSCQKSFGLHTELNDMLHLVNLSPIKIAEHFCSGVIWCCDPGRVQQMKAISQFGREGRLLSETFAAKNCGFGIYLIFGIVVVISAMNKCFRKILESTVWPVAFQIRFNIKDLVHCNYQCFRKKWSSHKPVIKSNSE